MMTKKNQDKEVYILGSESGKDRKKGPERNVLFLLICIFLAILVGIIIFFINRNEQTPEYYFEPEQAEQQSVSTPEAVSLKSTDETPYTEFSEETANGVPLVIYVPKNSAMSLMVGMPDKSDERIVFAAMAADIRKDNMQIVGDFVLSGKRLARGVSKKGYAAIEGNKITIGVGESTPLLQQTIENNGYFFRQYPLVSNGELVENNPKNKSIRRALAVRNEQVIIVASKNRESFHDFSQALIDIGVLNAIYLVGSDSFGWYHDNEFVRHEFGKELPDIPDNISYIIWR
jgi:Predicted periplasmic protein (DUF2233).